MLTNILGPSVNMRNSICRMIKRKLLDMPAKLTTLRRLL